MKYLKQLGIIMLVSCIGEVIKYYISLPVSASIYGLCLMMILLITGIIKIDDVKETGEFLIEIMPLMFIPSAAGLLVNWSQMEKILMPVVVIIVTSTLLVMVVTGRVTQRMIRRKSNE